MTRDELKAEIDSLLGMESRLVEGIHESELQYLSPTGILLFAIVISSATHEVWRIGGFAGGVLPNQWPCLMQLHRGPPREREEEVNDE